MKPGKKHILLFYQYSVDRMWQLSFPAALLLTAWWLWGGQGLLPAIPGDADFIVYIGALASIFFTLFGLLTRSMAYIQAREDHLRLVTPFIRVKISYRRIRSVYTTTVRQAFPIKNSSWAQRRFLEEFYPMTAVLVDLKSFPMNKTLLKVFLGGHWFLPGGTGIILLVKDWMKLSSEIDSLQGAWLTNKLAERTEPFSQYGLLGKFK